MQKYHSLCIRIVFRYSNTCVTKRIYELTNRIFVSALPSSMDAYTQSIKMIKSCDTTTIYGSHCVHTTVLLCELICMYVAGMYPCN